MSKIKLPPLPSLDKPSDPPLWGFWSGAFPIAAEPAVLVRAELCAPTEPVTFLRLEVCAPAKQAEEDAAKVTSDG
jgi:hypothetical protein